MQTFPLTAWQHSSLLLEQHPKANRNFLTHTTHSIAMRVRPGLSERRLRRAFAQLCARHDVTRLVIDRNGSEAKCCILESRASQMGVHDYAGAAEKDIEAITHKHARSFLPLIGHELVQLDLLMFGDLGDVVVFRVHACLTDGFGMTLMRDDLMKFYFQVPIVTSAVGYGAYYQGWGKDRAMSGALAERFWEDKLLPAPPPPQIGRVKRGMPILQGGLTWQTGADYYCDLTAGQVAQLSMQAQAAGTTAFMLANTAFIQTVAQAGEVDDVLYSLTLGRHDNRLFQYAGHHALHPLMRFRHCEGQSVVDAAQNHAQQWRETLDHLPAIAARREGTWDRRLLDAGSYPRQITTGSRMPLNGNRKSSGAAALPSEDGTVRIWSMELSEIAMPHYPGDFDELVLRAEFEPGRSALQFRYDADAYSEDEIAALAQDTFARLGLKVGSTQSFA
ncbi:condensation domain-containing protein [Sulfitobacter mediterraneus]|uniref:condensation domain-containing protein n=1 Tax=Sulfitobacter mediterraneus TaxID=83219 RepID=UPI0021A88319|nr:condensation domain-containing protein [Sulfitobacter mediterraneus]UWR12042.1 hypothetical protein K3753_03945 [Sulfitobacter mediterraneus]